MNRSSAPGLDRERLIAAGFAVLEQVGLEGLSMRRVAAHLGVQAPAIYWHVQDKAELLGMMARDVYASAYAAVPPASHWRAWLLDFGRALRRSFAGYRDGARLCAVAKPSSSHPAAEQADSIAAPLKALGLDQRAALEFQAAVISYALGWAMFEANGPMHEFLDRILVFESSFEAGLQAMVAGFAEGSASDRA